MVYPLTTTLDKIYACNPCTEGWQRALEKAGKAHGDDEPITYAEIIDAAGLEDALWCCRAEPQHAHIWRRYAVWCARQVQHLMTDDRSIAALEVAERHANGLATDDELVAARVAAWAAARDAAGDAAGDATRAATRAATWAAAWAAARDAAWDAAGDAAGDATRAATRAAASAAAWAAAWAAARDAARDAAWDAAWAAAGDAQSSAFRQLVTTGTLP